MSRQVLIIGTGNWMYGDEAAGIMVAHRLGRRLGQAVSVSYDINSTDELLNGAPPCGTDTVVLVAIVDQNDHFPAGSWCRIDCMVQKPQEWFRRAAMGSNSTLMPLLHLGDQLRSRGIQCWVYILSAADRRLGAPLSFSVKRVIESFASQIERDICEACEIRGVPDLEFLSPMVSLNENRGTRSTQSPHLSSSR